MKIAVVGGTGNVGSRIVAEAQRRAHDITIIARRLNESRGRPNVTTVRGDLNDPRDVALLSEERWRDRADRELPLAKVAVGAKYGKALVAANSADLA